MHYGAHRLAPPSYYERLRKEKAKHKPKLTQKYGGWICTGENLHVGTILRWAETPEEAYEDYLKACKEVEDMVRKAKTHGAIAQVSLHKMTQRDIANIEAIDYTRPAYSSYDIYENDNDTIDLRPYELLKVVMACVAVCSFIVYLIVC